MSEKKIISEKNQWTIKYLGKKENDTCQNIYNKILSYFQFLCFGNMNMKKLNNLKIDNFLTIRFYRSRMEIHGP